MKHFCKPSLLSLIVASILSPIALANNEDTSVVEHISIFGANQSLNDIPGSAHVLSQQALEIFDYSDIMRTLTSVPGVYVLEEDGYGLRPNIGMRGTGQNRSEKVTIMEDNVLAAPAPYAAPSAYYFPTSGRMQQVEVLKGTSSAVYGPRTTGGVVNLLSRQIPQEALAGRVAVQAGQDGFAKLHAYVGTNSQNFGSLFELYRYQADGFKHINHSNNDTGFVKNDLLGKLRFNSDVGSNFYQELELKVKYSDEDSDETYMGLTEDDYNRSPYSRYSASQKDNMATEHSQVQINHLIELNKRFALVSNFYHNDFSRNWYKTSSVNGSSLGAGGIEIAADFDQQSDSVGLIVDVKANSRDYLSQGIQTVLNADLNEHQVKFGLRLHKDEMDRFQWVDKYLLDASYQMTLSSAGVPGTDSNRIDSAEALALFVHDQWAVGDFVINAGLRYEDMVLDRRDWGKEDPSRITTPSYKENKVDVFLPSLAVTYRLTQDMVLLAGVQKGFAPPAPGNASATNEESMNFELGARYAHNQFRAEAIVFQSDYENMHGNCTASQNCDDENIGDQYNAGEVDVSGLELKAGYIVNLGEISMPLDFTYTYTQTEFMNTFESDFWGDVQAGDEFPYVPENQFQFTLGLEQGKWHSNILVRYSSEMRTRAGNGVALEPIKSRTIVDLVAGYHLAENQQISFSIDNLLDEKYMSSRVHGSIMVGKPLSANIGYKYSF
ncbi:TonB-dependent receptor [Paraglaciecola aquimarina]|uniref:TonB-dependent receptor n=1 Tax=Paraglaciecola algarum TaxID=3050085 RepID=A0ABS9D8S3_9ALTE|nr:TonB-dependent receptor [Paraglaciecola sp. G1-23]MCF2949377.1 TonB-dependent receptor [Paraglaciecola sp. G1-23]